MSIRKLRSGRVSTVTATQYVGEKGSIFWNETDGEFRLSDGVTPGGKIVTNLSLAATGLTPPINPYVGELWYNPNTKELWAYYNGAFRGTINPATPTALGGIKAGPGVVVASDGTLSLDSTGIPFNFGDFYAFTNEGPSDGACLSSINADQDVNIVSNGAGTVNIVGVFNIHKTNENLEDALSTEPVFAVSAEGKISAQSLDIQRTGDLGLVAALNVTINADGLTKTPTVISGSVAQFTGRDSRSPIILIDSYGIDADRTVTGGELTFRTGRGTNGTTTAVQSGDRLGEVTAAGWASNGYGGLAVGGLRIIANENFTSTARGSKLELYVIPNGTLTQTTIATVNSSGITLASGKILTGNVSGNAGTVTNGVYTTDTGTVTNTMLAGSIANNKLSNSSVTVNGTAISLGGSGTVTAAASTLTGTTLASNVVTSSLTAIASASNILAGQLTINPTNVVKNTASVQTFTLTGITTSHKILALPATALGYGISITAVWPSASNIVSVEIQNASNADVDLGNISIDYFSWV